MRSKFLTLAAVASIAAGGFTSSNVLAADNAAAPARERVLQRIAGKLNLTADQRTQIKAAFAGERNTLAPLLAALHGARENLRAAIRASDANETSVRAASAKVAAAEAGLAVERMRLYGKIAPILTEAQRRQLAGMRQRADDFVDNVIARIGPGPGN